MIPKAEQEMHPEPITDIERGFEEKLMEQISSSLTSRKITADEGLAMAYVALHSLPQIRQSLDDKLTEAFKGSAELDDVMSYDEYIRQLGVCIQKRVAETRKEDREDYLKRYMMAQSGYNKLFNSQPQ